MAKAWIKAARLRTLPLTLVCIGTGSAAAYVSGRCSPVVFALTFLTAVLLQVLSNFANDYGDFVKGTDNEARVGPQRAVQSGAITRAQMLAALWVCGLGALASGIGLLVYALDTWTEWLVFFGLGLVSILAAVTYTVGRHAYGYNGLGDVMVFIFFGLTGVWGSYYLQTATLDALALLPAVSVGLFSTGVLNMNNLRDIENDRACGKITVPVRIGEKATKIYQAVIVVAGLVSAGLYFVLLRRPVLVWGLLPAALFFSFHLAGVFREKRYAGFDRQLKLCVASTLLFGLSFAVLCFAGF